MVQAGMVDVDLSTFVGELDHAHEREVPQEDQPLGQSGCVAQLPQAISPHHRSACDGQCQQQAAVKSMVGHRLRHRARHQADQQDVRHVAKPFVADRAARIVHRDAHRHSGRDVQHRPCRRRVQDIQAVVHRTGQACPLRQGPGLVPQVMLRMPGRASPEEGHEPTRPVRHVHRHWARQHSR